MSLAVRTADTQVLRPSRDSRKLDGKIALITGGAKGMGGTIAELFAMEGARLALAARSVPDLDAELERISGSVPDVEGISITADVTDEASTQAMAARTLERFGRIDILVSSPQQQLSFVTVELVTLRDSARIAITTTDSTGRALFSNIPAGSYLLRFSRVNFAGRIIELNHNPHSHRALNHDRQREEAEKCGHHAQQRQRRPGIFSRGMQSREE